jgi:hypothetical protein
MKDRRDSPDIHEIAMDLGRSAGAFLTESGFPPCQAINSLAPASGAGLAFAQAVVRGGIFGPVSRQ